jgi:phosphatidylglycerophosphate synthase
MTNSLRASAIATALVGLAAVVGCSMWLRAELQLGDIYPFKAAAFFAIVSLLVLAALPGSHPFAHFGIANQVTAARAVLVVLIASLIGEPPRPQVVASAAALSLVATMLDGLDGRLARRTGMQSRFGARFDMEVDSLLILALALLAAQNGKAGPWVILSGLLRYLFIAAGWRWAWLRRPLQPSRRRQTICVVQIAALTLTMVPAIGPPVSQLLAGAALLSLCYSFLVDTAWLWRARRERGP